MHSRRAPVWPEVFKNRKRHKTSGEEKPSRDMQWMDGEEEEKDLVGGGGKNNDAIARREEEGWMEVRPSRKKRFSKEEV